jgi:molybdate transport system substrate-binding protein
MRRRLIRAGTVVVLAAVAGGLAGCGSAGGGAPTSAGPPAPGATPRNTGRIVVFAAASLTEVFTGLGRRFEAANPGTSITFDFGPSSALATQITEGAPADVFASASEQNMATVVRAGAATASAVFARNVMEIVVPPDNPAGVTALTDLGRPAVTVALCQPEVPCGVAAAAVLANAAVAVRPVTLEADVKATLAKVELGEVDAGVVYVTDVRAAGSKVLGVPIPARFNAATRYPIAALTAAKNVDLARAFVGYVRSGDGARVLAAAGFQRP